MPIQPGQIILYGENNNSRIFSEVIRSDIDTSGLPQTMERETAQIVKQAVERDFAKLCRITDTDAFLQTLMPVESNIIKAIKTKLVAQNDYNLETKKWRDFPAPGGSPIKEDVLYGVFIKVAHAIHQAAKAATNKSPTADQLQSTEWVDYHSRTLKTKDKYAAPIRPDCLLALSSLKDQDPEKPLWWLQIVAAVEVKRADEKNWLPVVKQLIGYLQRVLREQLDRRFVFGLTLGQSTITVWMHDRSGVLGTKTAIDIHEEPDKFIQIIAAFAVLPAYKLGFDPTMRLYVSPTRILPSYMLEKNEIVENQKDPYKTRWVIKLNDGKEYLTIKALSIARANIMRGRGSIVFVVIPFQAQEHASSRQDIRDADIFVLKQSWRPLNVLSEGDFYNTAKAESSTASDCVGGILLSEEVKILGGEDETTQLIRGNLAIDMPPAEAEEERELRSDDIEPYLHIVTTDGQEILSFQMNNPQKVVPRVRTRVLLSTYGWPIKKFSSLNELLHTMKDAITGHKYLYDNGVLHRDISPGNIIIKWKPDSDQTNSVGCLIDLDHAKKGNKLGNEIYVPPIPTQPWNIPDLKLNQESHSFLPLLTDIRDDYPDDVNESFVVTADVVKKATAIFRMGDALTYATDAVIHALKFGHVLAGTCSEKVLAWEQVQKIYDYHAPGRLQSGSRTGTPPYTSYEILAGDYMFDSKKTKSAVPEHLHHEAIHDLESFFWVLVYICLTRNGPGGKRRKELDEKFGEKTQAPYRKKCMSIREIVYCLFDGNIASLMANKRKLFHKPDDLRSRILDNFHPYFDKLKPLIEEWFSLLVIGYNHRAYELHNIHNRTIKILERALQSLDSEPTSEMEVDALQIRSKDITDIRDAASNIRSTARSIRARHRERGNK